MNDLKKYFSENEFKMFLELLRKANDCLSNRICNDFNVGEFLSLEERIALDKKMMEFNRSPEEHDPQQDRIIQMDWFVVAWCISQLKKCFDEKP
jgi:hypothetical protein